MYRPQRLTLLARRMANGLCGAAVIAAVLSMATCSFLPAAPDPAAFEARLADAQAEELDLVRATIGDPERAARFIELLGQRDRIIDRFVDDVARHREAMSRLSADYDAERGDFDALLNDYNDKRFAGQREIVDLIVSMKLTATAEEWRTISKFQTKKLDIRRLAYRSPGGGD